MGRVGGPEALPEALSSGPCYFHSGSHSASETPPSAPGSLRIVKISWMFQKDILLNVKGEQKENTYRKNSKPTTMYGGLAPDSPHRHPASTLLRLLEAASHLSLHWQGPQLLSQLPQSYLLDL